jgi:hypothetical protein
VSNQTKILQINSYWRRRGNRLEDEGEDHPVGGFLGAVPEIVW